MSGADMLVAAINGAIPRSVPIAPKVGFLSSVGMRNGQMIATITGITMDTLVVPQAYFSSWFLSETAGKINGRMVLVIFTDGDQYVVLTTLAPAGL